jgi:transcriptional regulator with XRE-family HTH domain
MQAMKSSPPVLPKTPFHRWRLENGLSLQELSDLTGISTAMLSRAERGLRSFAPLTKVRIARLLGVPVSELFEVEAIPEDVA